MQEDSVQNEEESIDCEVVYTKAHGMYTAIKLLGLAFAMVVLACLATWFFTWRS